MAYWRTLEDSEKDTWLAWDKRRQSALETYENTMADKKLLSAETQALILLMKGW